MTFIKTLGPTGNLIAVDGLMPGSPQQIEDMVDAINGAGGSAGVGFNVQAYGATGNGVTDDSVAIRAAITASIAAGGGTVYFPNGTYIVSKDLGYEHSSVPFAACLGIPANTTLLGQSKTGAIIKMAAAQPGSTRILGVDSVNDVFISNLTIDGNRSGQTPSDEHMGGILIASIAGEQFRLTIRDCVFHSCGGDGITVHTGARDVLIENCYVYGNGRDGIAVTGGGDGTGAGTGENRIIIRNCQCVGSDSQQLDVEPPDGSVYNLLVDGCYFARIFDVPEVDYAVAITGASVVDGMSGLVFTNNVVEGATLLREAVDCRVTNNRFSETTDDRLALFQVDGRILNCIITNNHFDANFTPLDYATAVGITGRGGNDGTESPTRVIFANNTVKAYGNEGVNILGAWHLKVAGNTLLGNSASALPGIEIRVIKPSQYLELSGNHIQDFAIGIQVHGFDGPPASYSIDEFVMTGNIAQAVGHVSMIAWELNHDVQDVIAQAIIYGNDTQGTLYTFAPTSGGLPAIPVLIGGNHADLGAQYWSAATPEGAIAANAGSLAMRASTGHGTQLYVKTTDAVNTGWVQVMSTAATGTITCTAKANYIDTDYMAIPDALLGTKVYEFDTAGDGASGGRIAVNISGATTAANVAAILKTAIEASQGTLIVTDAGSGVLTLAHKIAGVIGNVTITENVANAGHTVAGLTGGVGA